jgi:hypothetical protein
MNMTFYQKDFSKIHHFINKTFHQQVISLTIILLIGFFICMSFHHKIILLTRHFINRSFHQQGILSTNHIVNKTFHKQVISSISHFSNKPFYQNDISSKYHFSMHFIKKTQSSGQFTNLTFHQKNLLKLVI